MMTPSLLPFEEAESNYVQRGKAVAVSSRFYAVYV
jgi:hypothetical protein